MRSATRNVSVAGGCEVSRGAGATKRCFLSKDNETDKTSRRSFELGDEEEVYTASAAGEDSKRARFWVRGAQERALQVVRLGGTRQGGHAQKDG